MKSRPAIERFMAKVDKTETCWFWTGAKTPQGGYGKFKAASYTLVAAHRWIYTALVGPIPDGLTLDHTCHTADLACAGSRACKHRLCVNPAHLEPVTQAENNRRAAAVRTHCPQGHAYSPDNLLDRAGRGRECKQCNRDRARRHYRDKVRTPEVPRSVAQVLLPGALPR